MNSWKRIGTWGISLAVLVTPWEAYSYCGGGGIKLPSPPPRTGNPPAPSGPSTGNPTGPSVLPPTPSGPSTGGGSPTGPQGPGPTTGAPTPRGTPGNGPYTGSPVRPAGPTPANGSGPSTGGATPAGPQRPGPRTGGGGTVVLTPEPWLVWWQLNASEFLRPNRLGSIRGITTGEEFARIAPPQIAEEKRKALAKILPYLDHPEHMVKLAAVLAMGKLGGKDAIGPLTAKLSDPHPEVREGAILALGTTGEESVAPLLLRIAETGAVDKGQPRISPRSKPYALIALGIGRQRGLSPRVDGFVGALAKNGAKGEREALTHGALLFDSLAPAEGLQPLLAELLADAQAPRSLRCRAIEALGAQKRLDSFTRIVELLRDEDAQLRRSAALALGSFGEASAIPYLRSAVEKDRDELVQGFALISLGRLGGASALDTFAKTFDEGPSRNLPWCALATGILARNADSEPARKLLRKRFDRVKNHEIRGAFLIALGLSRDSQAVPDLEDALRNEKDPWTRTNASLALALSGSPRARDILLAALEKEDSSYLRVMFCMGLGYLGDSRDVGVMVKTLRELNNPQLQGSLAMALGYHGSKESMKGLFETMEDGKTPDGAKGAAIEALGVLLGVDPTPALTQIARQANFDAFPDWMEQLLQMTI